MKTQTPPDQQQQQEERVLTSKTSQPAPSVVPAPSTMRSHAEWMMDKKRRREHITFEGFVYEFQYFDPETAYKDFEELLEVPNLGEKTLKQVETAYTSFLANHSKLFWSERIRQQRSTIKVNEAASVMESAGLKRMRLALDFTGNECGRLVGEDIDHIFRAIPTTKGTKKVLEVKEEQEEKCDKEDDEEAMQDVDDVSTQVSSIFEPFIEFLYHKIQRKRSPLPPIPSSFSSEELQFLATYVHNSLKDLGTMKLQSSQYQIQKPILVAMSGIMDASPISPHTQADLLSYSREALVPQLDVPDQYVTQLSREILNAMTLEGQNVDLDNLIGKPSILPVQRLIAEKQLQL
ncbi:hypothetical protein BGZ81_003828 [Podila clonocystis]|nr:hypothetical protein BGZ81_003828 [Podila clonocystis]